MTLPSNPLDGDLERIHVCREDEDWPELRSECERVLPLVDREADPGLAGWLLLRLAEACFETGDDEAARKSLSESIAETSRSGEDERSELVRTLTLKAKLERELRDTDSALDLLGNAIELVRAAEAPDHVELANLHHDVAWIHCDREDYPAALDAMAQAIEHARVDREESDPWLATFYAGMGLLHYNAGELATALDWLRRALCGGGEFPFQRADHLSQTAAVLQDLDRVDEARECLDEAIALYEPFDTAEVTWSATAVWNQGLLELAAGNLEDARRLLLAACVRWAAVEGEQSEHVTQCRQFVADEFRWRLR